MARQVCVSFVFRALIVAMILGSTIATSLDNPYLSATRRAQLDQLNTAFGGLFLLEAALKLFAMGGREYARSVLNLFDGAMVLAFLVDLVLRLLGSSRLSQLSAVRSFRALRIFTLMATRRHPTPTLTPSPRPSRQP